MAKSVDEEWVEKKLRSANDTMESVQTLSLWALNHKSQCEQIVAIWLKVLKSVESNQMVIMFYLCNEVLQTCKKKNAQMYKECFKKVLKEATSVVMDEKVVSSLQKILKIWRDRNVYEESFLDELHSILSGEMPVGSNQPRKKSDENLEASLPKRSKLDIRIFQYNLASLCSALKSDSKQKMKLNDESARCSQFLLDVDQVGESVDEKKAYLESNTEKINSMCKLCTDLDEYLNRKQHLCDYLELATQFYEGQLKDVKLVSLAYKNYNNRVANLSKKLTDRRHLLMLSEQERQNEEEEEDDEEEDEEEEEKNVRNKHVAQVSSSRRERTKSGGSSNYHGNNNNEDEEDKLFTHLFLEDPAPPDDDLSSTPNHPPQLHHPRQHHQSVSSSRSSTEISTGKSRRQSLDARLEMLGLAGFSSSNQDEEPSSKISRQSSHVQQTSCHSKATLQEPSKRDSIEEAGIKTQPPMNHYQSLQTSQMELSSFKPHNYHLLQQPYQNQQQQLLYSQQQVYVPQLVQPQQLSQVNEEDEGRSTPVQDERPVSVSPNPSVKEYMTGSKNVSDDKSHSLKLEDFLSSLRRSSEKYSSSSRRHKSDKKRDGSPRKSSHKSDYKEEGSRKSRERSYEDGRSKERRQGNKEKSHRGGLVSKEKHHEEKEYQRRDEKEYQRHDEKEYVMSSESSKYSKSRRRSRERSPSSECHSSGAKLKKSSSHYSPSSSKQSKTKDRSPHKRKRSASRSPPLGQSVSSGSATTTSKLGEKYLKNISGSEIVMDGIYQAVERADGYSEIYRLPSDIDPSQYTYEEVVYVFTEEDDGVSQLKQLNQNVSATPTSNLFSSGIQYLTSSCASIFSNSQFAGTFPVGSSLGAHHIVSSASSSAIQNVPNTMSLSRSQQQLIPVNVLSGLVQQPHVQPQILAPGQVPVQIPPPPLPQPAYSFVQQPPPPLPASVIPPAIVPQPSLLVNQLKNSTSQTSSLLDVSLLGKLPMSTPSYSGISKVLPSPSQFCQGIGATALLQRRLDENLLERSRSSQSSQVGKQQVTSSTRRTSNLTTIQLTDDVATSEIKFSGTRAVRNLMSFSDSSIPNEAIEAVENQTTSVLNTAVNESTSHPTENVNPSDGISKEHNVNEKPEESHSGSVIFADNPVPCGVDISNDQLPDSSSTELLPRQESASENMELSSQEPDSTRGGDDEFVSDDDDSSDLDELQSSVTFTAPLSVAGHSTLTYAQSRGKDTRSQSNLLRRPSGVDGRNFLPRVINNNRIRPLLPNALLPGGVTPLFPIISQYQPFGSMNVIGATGFNPQPFAHGPRLPLRLPMNVRLPMPFNRIHFPGNPRF